MGFAPLGSKLTPGTLNKVKGSVAIWMGGCHSVHEVALTFAVHFDLFA